MVDTLPRGVSPQTTGSSARPLKARTSNTDRHLHILNNILNLLCWPIVIERCYHAFLVNIFNGAVLAVISTLKLSGWPTKLVFSQLKEYSISLNCYKDIYP